MPNDAVKKAIEYFLLVSGQILDAARAGKRYIPQISAGIQEVIDICDAYMEALESASIANRYGTPDENKPDEVAGEAIRRIRFVAERLDELRRIELPSSNEFDLHSQGE